MTSLDKASEAFKKHDWYEAGKQMLNAAQEKPDFDRAADYVMLAASCFNNMRLNTKLRLG